MTAENTGLTKLKDPRLWSEFGFTGQPTSSGQTITPDSALALSAYYDGIRIISEDIAKLPFVTFERLEPRGKRRASDHPVYPLLKVQPNPNMTSLSFRETLTSHAIGWGGGFAMINRNRRGDPAGLDIIHPSRVETDLDRKNELFYKVVLGSQRNEMVIIRQENMFHLHGISPDGMNGYSVARVGAESLGRGMAAERFSASFFRSGSSPTGVLTHPMQFKDKEAIDRMRRQFQETYAGESGWWKPIILEQGMDWKSISIPPEDAQLIETNRFSILDIARWLRIAPHKLAELEHATFSNIEEQNIDHVVDTLMPWMRRWEEEASRKLFTGDDRFFAEHQVQALLRGNQEARGTFYREQFNIGALSQNDIRDLENMNPIEGGDTYYINGSLVRTEDAAKGMTTATTLPPAGRTDGNDNEADQSKVRGLISCCLERCYRKELLASEAAVQKHTHPAAFLRWQKGFYKRHQVYMTLQLGPTLQAIEVLSGLSFNRDTLEEFVTEYISQVLESARGAEAGAALLNRIMSVYNEGVVNNE